MAPTKHNSFAPSPLNCSCPPHAAEPSSHTITERRCWILRCVDLGNGFHYSQTTHCMLNSAQNSFVSLLNSSTISRVTFASPIALTVHNTAILAQLNRRHSTMARTCHQMHSRRGGICGGSTRLPSTPSHDYATPSSSPSTTLSRDHLYGSYPDTCSGRGRKQAHGVRRMNVATQTANLPTPLHPSLHTTQFRFHITLNHPDILATATVTFSEEINLQNEQDAQLCVLGPEEKNSGEQQKADKKNKDHCEPEKRNNSKQQTAEKTRKAGSDSVLHGEELVGGKHAIEGNAGGTLSQHAGEGSSAGTQAIDGLPRGTSAEDDDWYEYACRIVEESPPNETHSDS